MNHIKNTKKNFLKKPFFPFTPGSVIFFDGSRSGVETLNHLPPYLNFVDLKFINLRLVLLLLENGLEVVVVEVLVLVDQLKVHRLGGHVGKLVVETDLVVAGILNTCSPENF